MHTGHRPHQAIKAVAFEFSETRSGENVREFLRALPGVGRDKGVTSSQCMAQSRRKFHELWVNHGSQVGEQALRFYQSLFRMEPEVEQLSSDERRRVRQRKSRRVLAVFYRWLLAKRQLVSRGSATPRGDRVQLEALEGAHALRE
jgi:hypothetical protein